MDDAVRVRLLGPIEVLVDGDVVALPGAPQRVLTARLALSPGEAVPADELVAVLWPGEPPANATGNLHSYVSKLRRVVGADRLRHQAGGYRLRLDRRDIDIGQAEQLVAEARGMTVAHPARAAALLSEALDLWRGEPLADLPDRLPFAAQLAWLAEWRLAVTEEWFDLLLDTGQAAHALPDLERATVAEPLRERLCLLHMRALHLVGRTADALAVGRAYRERLVEEAGVDPGPALNDMERRLLVDDPELRPVMAPSATAVAPPRRYAPTDRFVGRAAELGRLLVALERHRVASVVGPGGVGKTRVVEELLDQLAAPAAGHDPTFVVRLGDVAAPADVPAAVATALGLQAAPAGAETAIADRLAGERALLVLDACEHLLDAVRPLVADLLARCPALRVLATSRQRIGVPGEQVIRIGPLPEDDRVTLFCDRAALLRDTFDTAAAPKDVVADICALVDGLPLAVELAARREAVLGLTHLRYRLAAGLDVLEPAERGDRSTAITATVEWSYRLLDRDTQVLFDRLAVCRGGFPPDALPHLCPTDNPEARLADLVEASMVVPELSAGPPRYRMLEPLRQVGAAHLGVTGRTDAEAAHARWVLAHVEAVHHLQNARSSEATRALRRELANLRVALTRLVDAAAWEDAARLGVLVALAVSDDPHLDLLGQLHRLVGVLDAPDIPDETRGLGAVTAGATAWLQGDADTADHLLTVGLAALPATHPQRWIGRFFRLAARMRPGRVVEVEADTAALVGDADAPAWIQATAVCCAALINLFAGDRIAGRRWITDHGGLLADVAPIEGFVAYTHGELLASEDPIGALAWFDRAHRQSATAGHTYNREVAAIGRVAVLIRLGRHADAVPVCRRLIGSLRDLGMWAQLWTCVRLTAELLVALDDPEPAAGLLAAADRDPLAPPLLGADVERCAALWARISDRLSGERLAAARASGEIGGRTGAVAVARAALDRHS